MKGYQDYCQIIKNIIKLCHQFLIETQPRWKSWIGLTQLKRYFFAKKLNRTVSQLPFVKELTVFFYPQNVIHLNFDLEENREFELSVSLSHCIYTNQNFNKIIGYKYTEKFWYDTIISLSRYIINDVLFNN
jgi:hypothetical protein